MAEVIYKLETVDRVYAQSLLELAEEAGRMDPIAAEVAELLRLLETEPELAGLLSSRKLTTAQRADAIERIFKGRTDDLVYHFIQVVNVKGRLERLGRILSGFALLHDEKRGVVKAQAYVAIELTEDQQQRIAEIVSAVTGREAVVQQRVDQRLLGGMKLRVGDLLVDASLATALQTARRHLIESGKQQARRLRQERAGQPAASGGQS